MTDEHNPDAPDERDPRIAELLEVAPLDDVTRRRLVDRAMAASEPARAGGRRLFAIAAAAALVFVGGVGAWVLVGDDGDGGSTTAARPKVAAEADTPAQPPAAAGGREDDQQRSAATSPAPAPNAGAVGAAVPADLGEVGDVSDPTRLRAAVAGAFTFAGRAAPEHDALASATCADAAGAAELPLVARATGTDDGDPVVILVVSRPDGSRRALVLDATSCETKRTVTL